MVIPHDHDDIKSQDGVIRRISEKQLIFDKAGQRRVSSMAFRPSTGQDSGMSVDLEQLIIEADLDPKAYVTTPYWTGSVYFEAGILRNEGFKVGYDPIPSNLHHGEVWGDFGKGRQRLLQSLARWFVPMEGVAISGE